MHICCLLILSAQPDIFLYPSGVWVLLQTSTYNVAHWDFLNSQKKDHSVQLVKEPEHRQTLLNMTVYFSVMESRVGVGALG